MKRLAIIAGVVASGCSQGGLTQNKQSTALKPVPTMVRPVARASTGAEDGRLPSVDAAQPRYVGRWAPGKRLCKTDAWRFYATHLTTAGDVSCSYDRADKVPGGFDLHATCTVEARPASDVIKLRFAESAQAMLIDSKILKATGLIYCGPLN